MNNKLIIFILATMIVAGCKNNIIELTGKLENPQNEEYIYLDELKSTELITVDSAIVSEEV